MMYLITFDRELLTTPLNAGGYIIWQQDGENLTQLPMAPLELTVEVDDVLQPALRNGFTHPLGLVVDASLVDIMTAPHRLENASAAQLALQAQLEELDTGPVSVADAAHVHQQDRVAREARLDHQEALSTARTARRDLVDRPVNDDLQRHWETRGR